MEQRLRDARRSEENVVRKCSTMAEEDSWSVTNQSREGVRELNQGATLEERTLLEHFG